MKKQTIKCTECGKEFDSFSHMGAHGHGGSGGGGGNRSEQTIMEESIRKMFTEYKENPKTNYSDKDRFFVDYCMAIFNSELDALSQEVEKLYSDKNKAYTIAEKVGKQPTNMGAIAQARIDGYKVALNQVLQLIRERR